MVEEVAPTVSKAPETPTEPKKTEADRESETTSSAMEKPVVETPPEKNPATFGVGFQGGRGNRVAPLLRL